MTLIARRLPPVLVPAFRHSGTPVLFVHEIAYFRCALGDMLLWHVIPHVAMSVGLFMRCIYMAT